MSYLEVSRYKKAWQIAQAEKVAVPGNQDYFVYLHIERDTDLPMYVGIGFRPNRPWDVTDRNVLHKNKIKKHGIRAVCRGEQIITGGYKFKYVEEEA